MKCKASVRIGKIYYTVDVHDISLEGMKVEPIQEYCVGKQVVVKARSNGQANHTPILLADEITPNWG